MASLLIDIITSADPKIRNQSLDAVCAGASVAELLAACAELEDFRRSSDNLYERVRALFFLYAIHRFHLPGKLPAGGNGLIPYHGFEHLLQRRFEEALEQFSAVQKASGPSDAISSALAAVYQRIGFQTLADQVRRSVRSVRGNQWMFRMGHPADHPLEIRPALTRRAAAEEPFPVLVERTAVRMDSGTIAQLLASNSSRLLCASSGADSSALFRLVTKILFLIFQISKCFISCYLTPIGVMFM